MTKEEAIAAIEAEFDAMTSKQRTTLWKTIGKLADDEFERGKVMGQGLAKP